SSWDQIGQQYVAVKKILDPFGTPATAQSIFREIKLLKRIKHDNESSSRANSLWTPLTMNRSFIHSIYSFLLQRICTQAQYPSLIILTISRYVVTDLMQTDLRTVLESRSIGNEFVPFLVYQIFRGLKYLHSAGVPHRDLQPGNILINQNCDLKICDLGLPRAQEPHKMSYISTKCYRAPELLLTRQTYDETIDVWSAGCIFAEMIQGKALFEGRNYVEQFCAITELLGTPDEHLLAKISSQSVSTHARLHPSLDFIQSLPYREGTGISNAFPQFDPAGLNLLQKMLAIDPDGRISASNALAAPYLSAYHDPTDEPIADHLFDWSINGEWGSNDTWKKELSTGLSKTRGGSTLYPKLDADQFIYTMTSNAVQRPQEQNPFNGAAIISAKLSQPLRSVSIKGLEF
ncbi:hypothetical protein N7541_003615, partial [Penicillium brevicompactum]